MVAAGCFALLCFVLFCFALFCCALLCFALFCFAFLTQTRTRTHTHSHALTHKRMHLPSSSNNSANYFSLLASHTRFVTRVAPFFSHSRLLVLSLFVVLVVFQQRRRNSRKRKELMRLWWIHAIGLSAYTSASRRLVRVIHVLTNPKQKDTRHKETLAKTALQSKQEAKKASKNQTSMRFVEEKSTLQPSIHRPPPLLGCLLSRPCPPLYHTHAHKHKHTHAHTFSAQNGAKSHARNDDDDDAGGGGGGVCTAV